MNDEWDDLMPDSGDNEITVGEAMYDTVMFIGKVAVVALAALVIIGSIVYSLWRELAIFSFLTSH